MVDDLIGTGEAAALLGMNERTVKRHANNGRLPVALKMPGKTGAYLFRRSDIEALRDEDAA